MRYFVEWVDTPIVIGEMNKLPTYYAFGELEGTWSSYCIIDSRRQPQRWMWVTYLRGDLQEKTLGLILPTDKDCPNVIKDAERYKWMFACPISTQKVRLSQSIPELFLHIAKSVIAEEFSTQIEKMRVLYIPVAEKQ